jgi:hypothetical protein
VESTSSAGRARAAALDAADGERRGAPDVRGARARGQGKRRWLARARTRLRQGRAGRVLRAAARARDLWPLTWLGLLVGLGSAAALVWLGLGRVDLVLLVVGGVGVALVLLSVIATSLAAAWIARTLRKRLAAAVGAAERAEGGAGDGAGPRPAGAEPLRAECGVPTATGFSLPSFWWIPFVSVGWSWEEPVVRIELRKRKGRVEEHVVPERRALRDTIVRRLVVADTFGLARIVFPFVERRDVRFLPSVGALKTMHVVRSMSGGSDLTHPDGPAEGERMDLRNYNPGDPIRYVLWKVFARTRELVVRTPERAISPVRQTVAYLVASDADEPAAGAARVAVDTGALGGEWVLGADGVHENARTKAQALELLAKSAEATEEDAGAGLAHFLRTAVPGSTGRAVVFVPGRPGPWLDRVVDAARAGGGGLSAVEFVVCTDGVVPSAPRKGVRRFLERRDPRGDAADDAAARYVARQEELGEVLDALARARARVLVVDRRAGRCYDGHYRQHLGGRA